MIALTRLLPFRLCANVFASLTARYSIRTRRHRRALANLAVAFPNSCLAEREEIARGMWRNVGRVIAEAIHIDRFLEEPQRLDLLSMRTIDELEDDKGLYIIVGMHSGNWEIGLQRTTLRGFQPAALYRTVENPMVDEYVRKSRSKTVSRGLVPLRSRPDGGLSPAQNTSRHFVKLLREGGPLGILADIHDPDGVEVPFFGRKVWASRVPATLAYQFNGRMCIARSIRVDGQSRFIGDAVVVDLPRTGNQRADIVTTTEIIFRQFETWIRQYPDQWLWSQAPFVFSHQV